MMIPDTRTESNLIIKCAALYTRRFAKTIGYILIIEPDEDMIMISKEMSKPKLTF